MNRFLSPEDARRSRSKSRPRVTHRESSNSSRSSNSFTSGVRDFYYSTKQRLSRSRSRGRDHHYDGRAPLPNTAPGLATPTREMREWRENWVQGPDGRARGERARKYDDQVAEWDENRRERKRRAEEDQRRQARAKREMLNDMLPSNQHYPRTPDYSDASGPPAFQGNPYPPGYYYDSRLPLDTFDAQSSAIGSMREPNPVYPPAPIERMPNPALMPYRSKRKGDRRR